LSKSPAVAVLAFIPMLLCSIGYSELNKADPDCGTTFTWATRAFGPKTGWAGGWAIVAADILVMASLAQVAGQYVFLLFNADGIGDERHQRLGAAGRHRLDRRDDLHLLPRHRGLGLVPAHPADRRDLMLLVLSVTRWSRWGTGSHPPATAPPELQLAAAVRHRTFSAFVSGIILMLFIYWGWDTAVSVNEETAGQGQDAGPGGDHLDRDPAGHLRDRHLSVQAFAGFGDKGIGLTNPAHQFDVLSVLGTRDLRHQRVRHGPVPAADPDGAQLGRRLHPDDDPADRPHHPVDGRLQGHPQSFAKIHPGT
jgi:amino acid transporter